MLKYSFSLPNEKAKTTVYVTFIILLMNCMVFGYLLLKSAGNQPKNVFLAGTVTSFISLLFLALPFQKRRSAIYLTLISFIIISLCWILLGKYLVAGMLIILATVGLYARRKQRITFSVQNIIYPSMPVKIFAWDDVSNVILKDNVLSIDLKNNKLIQVVLETGSGDNVNEQSFNNFCREQLAGRHRFSGEAG